MADLYGLTEEQLSRLRRVADAVDGGDTLSPTNAKRARHTWPRSYIGFLDSQIAGVLTATGTPRGSATFKVYSFSSTGTLDTGLEIQAYNFSKYAATTDRWSVLEVCGITGLGIITTQFSS